MFKFKKDRVLLLKELRGIVTTNLERSEQRRESRKLRHLRSEIDKWMKELKSDKKEELNETVDHA